jgi:hypothetical protein
MFKVDAGSISEWGICYRKVDYSIESTKVTQNPAGFPLMLNDLYLELNEEGGLISIWGLCPHPSWVAREFVLPPASRGSLRYLEVASLIPGIAHRLNSDRRWETWCSPTHGVLRLESGCQAKEHVQVAEEVIVSLDVQGSMTDLWLKPNHLDWL